MSHTPVTSARRGIFAIASVITQASTVPRAAASAHLAVLTAPGLRRAANRISYRSVSAAAHLTTIHQFCAAPAAIVPVRVPRIIVSRPRPAAIV